MPEEKPKPPKRQKKTIPTKRGAPISKEVKRMPQRARKNRQARGDQGKHQ